MFILSPTLTAYEISDAVKNRQITATEVLKFYLSRIDRFNNKLLAFTSILYERAIKAAEELDKRIINNEEVGALAGVPFAVKNLFDIKDTVTLAGSIINKANNPANKDAILIQRLEKQDAILVGALAMGEYAYDFTGENIHYGNCKNPWDISRMSGGSSSGSGSAVAAMLVPIALGSDTNGSIRVPSSLCGLFGLKPTYGRLPRTGSFPFCDSLDHLGPMSRSVRDLSLTYDTLQGYDDNDHACIRRDVNLTFDTLEEEITDLNIARATGYFDTEAFPQAHKAMEDICQALDITKKIELPGTLEARSAAYLITNAESSRLHLRRLQSQASYFDHDTRDRFIAGALLPSAWYTRALQVRHSYHKNILSLFNHVDIIVAPATPCVAPKIGQKTLTINGNEQALRPNLGYFTQAISAAGLPSCVVPTMNKETQLPIGVQIIAAPWREDLCLRIARNLEKKGFYSLNTKNFM